MNTLMTRPDLCIRDTGPERGRGVFALRRFAADELVEAAPILVLKVDYDSLPAQLKTYVFDWTALTGVPRSQAVALGYGSMYNHANPANLRYIADARANVMRYVAVRDIGPDEELTINYNALGGVHEWDDDNWFERAEIEMVDTHHTDDMNEDRARADHEDA
jgi:hypothetical protein